MQCRSRPCPVNISFKSDATKRATIRLAVDDWAIAWLNGEKVAAVRQMKGLKTVQLAGAESKKTSSPTKNRKPR